MVGTVRVEAVHEAPVWRHRANFLIGARLPEADRSEQLWAKRLEQDLRFQICCIPFFLYDCSLGDVVETDTSYDVVAIVERSGRSVFRSYFGDSFHPRERVVEELLGLGALTEWSSVDMLAVDAANADISAVVLAHLNKAQRDGRLTYEIGSPPS